MLRFESSKPAAGLMALLLGALALLATLALGVTRGFETLEALYCEALLPDTEVAVEAVADAPRYAHELTSAQIEALLPPKRRGGTALGATRANPSQEVKVSVKAAHLSGGRICVRPRVEVTFALKGLRVDVATEHPEGSCMYRETYRHEQHHVEAYLRELQRSRDELQATLKRRYRNNPVFYFKSLQDAEEDIKTGVRETLAPFASELMARSAQAHVLIDSPAEYRRLTLACPDEKAGRQPMYWLKDPSLREGIASPLQGQGIAARPATGLPPR